MKLVVGLGNPGNEYINTRHNAGFIVLDHYLEKYNFSMKEKYGGYYCLENIKNNKVLFLKPQKFMNLSGEVIKKFVDFYKIEIDDILVIYDDISYEVGHYKLKPKGSSGGHNGMKNIIKCLKTSNFKRLKIGISKNNINLISYVTSKFNNEEYKKLNNILNITDNIIDDFIVNNFDLVMTKYNK